MSQRFREKDKPLGGRTVCLFSNFSNKRFGSQPFAQRLNVISRKRHGSRTVGPGLPQRLNVNSGLSGPPTFIDTLPRYSLHPRQSQASQRSVPLCFRTLATWGGGGDKARNSQSMSKQSVSSKPDAAQNPKPDAANRIAAQL